MSEEELIDNAEKLTYEVIVEDNLYNYDNLSPLEKMKIMKGLLDLYKKEKETSHFIQSQLDEANAKLIEEKGKNKELENEGGKKYEILRLGNLALGYKTFLGREAMEDEIEIYEYDNTFSWRWTVASFEIREDKTIEIKSCGDRLKNIEDWNAFGQLVKEGYRILENLI